MSDAFVVRFKVLKVVFLFILTFCPYNTTKLYNNEFIPL